MSISFTGNHLIFLFSQPRAGSTLLQRILGSHPNIHTVSEPWIALHPLYALKETGIFTEYGHPLARTAVVDFLSCLPKREEAYDEALRRMLAYLYNEALEATGRTFFLDKTPRYYFIIPELRRLFPDAHFVFLLRNPIAVLVSILDRWVKTDTGEGLNHFWDDLVAAPGLLLQGIQHLGEKASVLQYEDLVGDPSATIRRLCEQLGLGFDQRMIEYGSAETTESVPPGRWLFGDQDTVYRERQPLRERADHWKRLIDTHPLWREIAHGYLGHLGQQLVKLLGYDYERLQAELQISNGAASHTAFLQKIGVKPLPGEKVGYAEEIQRLLAIAADRLRHMEEKEALLSTMNSHLQRRAEIIEEQQNALAAFRAALDARDAEIASLRERLGRSSAPSYRK